MSASKGRNKKPQVIYAGSTAAMDEGHFRLCQPLLEVNTGTVTKFDGKMLVPEVCQFFLKRLITQMDAFGKCYAVGTRIKQELNYRPVACAMLPVFASLAPRAGELLAGEDPKYLNKEFVVGFEQSAAVEMEIEGDSEGGSLMSDGSDLSGWSFAGGCFKSEDGASLKPREAVDVRGYVMDLSLPNRPLVPRSIFEMKGPSGWPFCVYQALYYGTAAAIENTRRGRYKKIHIVVPGIGWLGCAEIDPIGCLDIGPKSVLSLATVKQFKKHVEAKCKLLDSKNKKDKSRELRNKYLGKTEAALLDEFSRKMKLVMDGAATELNALAPPGSPLYSPVFNRDYRLLVGTATYRELPFTMLSFPLKEGAVVSAHDYQVVSGIARTVYGDRALHWSVPAVEALAADREREASTRAASLLGGPLP